MVSLQKVIDKSVPGAVIAMATEVNKLGQCHPPHAQVGWAPSSAARGRMGTALAQTQGAGGKEKKKINSLPNQTGEWCNKSIKTPQGLVLPAQLTALPAPAVLGALRRGHPAAPGEVHQHADGAGGGGQQPLRPRALAREHAEMQPAGLRRHRGG